MCRAVFLYRPSSCRYHELRSPIGDLQLQIADFGDFRSLTRPYHGLRETFAGFEAIEDINAKLADIHGEISSHRRLSLSV
jgi:hypothetical protein